MGRAEGPSFGRLDVSQDDDEARAEWRSLYWRPDPRDACRVHGRFLSRAEYEAGACLWCRPELDMRTKRANRDQSRL